jgi:ribosome-associated protein
LTSLEQGTPDVVQAAVRWALEKQALQPVLLNVQGLCTYTDFLLILGGRSTRQVAAVAESILQGMKQDGFRTIGTEGLDESRWVLMDYGELVVHVFLDELRDFYDLESLWIDARRIELDAWAAQAGASIS